MIDRFHSVQPVFQVSPQVPIVQVQQRNFEQAQFQAAYEAVGVASQTRRAYFGAVAAQDWCFVQRGESARELWERALAGQRRGEDFAGQRR